MDRSGAGRSGKGNNRVMECARWRLKRADCGLVDRSGVGRKGRGDKRVRECDTKQSKDSRKEWGTRL